MNTLFMNSENSKRSYPHVLLLNLAGKIVFRRKDKYIALSNLSICNTWKKQKCNIRIMNLKYQLHHEMKEFELPDGSQSISGIQDYFEYILKKA